MPPRVSRYTSDACCEIARHARCGVSLMAYPSTPTSLYINGYPEKPEKLTKNTDGTVSVSAVVNDPDSRDKVRMVVRYSKDKTFKTYSTVDFEVRSARGSPQRHDDRPRPEHAVLRAGLHPAARPHAPLEEATRPRPSGP